jgi:phage-related tail protein
MANVAKISQQKFETGTAYAPGGMALVGERGPEYVSLPAGSRVYNNSQTRNMTTNAALNVQIMDSSGNITETIRAQLRSGQADQLVRDIQAKIAQRI